MTTVGAQKINGTTLKINALIVFILSILDKNSRKRFFEKNFLLADVEPDVVLRMLFLTMSNANVDFQTWDL